VRPLGSWEFWLALKYILSPKRERFTGVITTIALIGLILSVCALTIVNAVITGFKEVVAEKILSLNPHLSVTTYDVLKGEKVLSAIEQAIPKGELQSIQLVTIQQGLLLKAGQPLGIILKGVDLSKYSQEKGFKFFQYHPQDSNSNGELEIVVGVRLRDRLGLSLGERLNYLSVEGVFTPFGFFPKIIPVRVIGFFESGLYDYDLSIVFTSFDQLSQRFLPKALTLELKLRDPFKSERYRLELIRNLGYEVYILDWQEWNRNLFSALKMEKIGLFIVLTLMVTVSLFTILSAMIMLVSEKRGDIAILRALGATSKQIMKVFFLSGFLLSSVGVLIGVFLGIAISQLLSRYPIIKLPGEVYPVEYLPISLKLFDLLLIGGIALAISIFACLYPARKASLMSPAEILRRE